MYRTVGQTWGDILSVLSKVLFFCDERHTAFGNWIKILIFLHFKLYFIQFCLVELEGNAPAVMRLIFYTEVNPYIIMKAVIGSMVFYKDETLA